MFPRFTRSGETVKLGDTRLYWSHILVPVQFQADGRPCYKSIKTYAVVFANVSGKEKFAMAIPLTSW